MLQVFEFSQLKDIWLNVKVDLGTTSVRSDTARKQMITNLLAASKIEFIDWLERIGDEDIPDWKVLIDKLRPSMTDNQLLYGLMARFVDGLPPAVQAELEQLRLKNPEEYEMCVKKMMVGEANGMPGVQQPAAGQQVPA